MSVIRCKVKGKNIDIRASDISAYKAEENGTTVLLNTGDEILVDESFQAVRNRVVKAEAGEASDE